MAQRMPQRLHGHHANREKPVSHVNRVVSAANAVHAANVAIGQNAHRAMRTQPMRQSPSCR